MDRAIFALFYLFFLILGVILPSGFSAYYCCGILKSENADIKLIKTPNHD